VQSNRWRFLTCGFDHTERPCAFRKSYPNVMVVQPDKIGMATTTPVCTENQILVIGDESHQGRAAM
jgi:hypothetical protein